MLGKKAFIPLSFRPKVKGENLDPSVRISRSFPKNSSLQSPVEEKAICLHVKDDDAQTKVLKKLNFDQVLFLCYDELGDGWNFSFYQGELLFLFGNRKIKPLGIYDRPYFPPEEHEKTELFRNFQECLDLWKGEKIGASKKNFSNSSKPYQLRTTISKALKDDANIKIPFSFFIKGRPEKLTALLKDKKLIVKSCSGIRSEVVTDEIFMQWDRDNLHSLPTFFQEYVEGKDIRVHVMEDQLWSVEVAEKSSTDYRYANERSPYEKCILNEKIQTFSFSLAQEEKIRLCGIDLIQRNETYFCLECNPSPGWAGFHRYSKEEDLLARSLIKKLVREIS